MDDQVLANYYLCNDVLKALDHSEDLQRQMSDAEEITTAIVALRCFRGNWERAQDLLGNARYIPTMLSKSRFNRHLPAIGEWFLALFQVLSVLC